MEQDILGLAIAIFLLIAIINQLRKFRPDIIFSICLLLYIAIPSTLDIYSSIADEGAIGMASLLSKFFILGYLISQFSITFKKRSKEFDFYAIDVSGKKLILIGYGIIVLYIIGICIYSAFDRNIIHELISTRVQIALIFLFAFSFGDIKSNKDAVYYYLPMLSAAIFLFISGSRIFVIPAVIFMLLLNLRLESKTSIKIVVAASVLFGLIVPILRNFSGDLFSERNLVSLTGEWYFTYLSFIYSIQNNLNFDQSFMQMIFIRFLPFIQEVGIQNSDAIINESLRLDFGIGSSYLADIKLFGVDEPFSYLMLGLFVGAIYRFCSFYSRGFMRIAYMIFLSFTPIIFRSGFMYNFALLKSILAYSLIIWLFLIATSILKTRRRRKILD